MAKVSGIQGDCTFNSEDIKITDWELDIEEDAVDTTDSGNSGWATSIPKGISRWSGRFTGKYDDGDTVPAAGDSATLVLDMTDSTNFTGTANITRRGMRLTVPDSEVVLQEFEFTGTGALTEN